MKERDNRVLIAELIPLILIILGIILGILHYNYDPYRTQQDFLKGPIDWRFFIVVSMIYLSIIFLCAGGLVGTVYLFKNIKSFGFKSTTTLLKMHLWVCPIIAIYGIILLAFLIIGVVFY